MARYVSLGFDPVLEAAGIPEGTYKAQVLEATQKTASTGSEMIEVQLSVVDDPQYNGRRIYDNIVLTPKAAWKLVQFCKAFDLDPRSIDLDSWVGRTAWIDVTLQQDSGRPQIDKYRAA